MIELKNYTMKLDDQVVLSNINFHFGKQTYLLKGHMHKRKSKLLNELAKGFTSYNQGIKFSNESGIAYLPNKQFLLENLTVKQNLDFFGKFFNAQSIKIKVISNHFELDDIANRQVTSLSLGVRQLLRIACVCLNTHASIYLFDDLFNSLSKSQIDIVKKYLKLIELDNTIIISKLNKHEIEDFKPRLIQIVNKKLQYEGE